MSSLEYKNSIEIQLIALVRPYILFVSRFTRR